jgi:ubiquinone/menaquinone biosynthesis C-methylase UbiE
LPGILLHAPRLYDLQVWIATRGRERALRRAILQRAQLKPGEAVLDVGCGTANLALAARGHVGLTGEVFGIDASPEMVAAAKAKARKAGLEVSVTTGQAQNLTFADERFDLVTSTLMLHHLPHPGREAAASEMRRVLKRGGRALVVDFASSSRAQGGFLHSLHRHGRVRPDVIIGLLADAGLEVTESGPLGMRDLHYVLAVKPAAAS